MEFLPIEHSRFVSATSLAVTIRSHLFELPFTIDSELLRPAVCVVVLLQVDSLLVCSWNASPHFRTRRLHHQADRRLDSCSAPERAWRHREDKEQGGRKEPEEPRKSIRWWRQQCSVRWEWPDVVATARAHVRILIVKSHPLERWPFQFSPRIRSLSTRSIQSSHPSFRHGRSPPCAVLHQHAASAQDQEAAAQAGHAPDHTVLRQQQQRDCQPATGAHDRSERRHQRGWYPRRG